MATIEIDFDLFKELTLRRSSESETMSDVIRKALAATAPTRLDASKPPTAGGVVYSGVTFPEGTQFQATYKGRTYHAEIKNGSWVGSDGVVRRSPSDAATGVTNTNVNGWRFWRAKRPGDTSFRLMDLLRGS
jgi:hypothetical protein